MNFLANQPDKALYEALYLQFWFALEEDIRKVSWLSQSDLRLSNVSQRQYDPNMQRI